MSNGTRRRLERVLDALVPETRHELGEVLRDALEEVGDDEGACDELICIFRRGA